MDRPPRPRDRGILDRADARARVAVARAARGGARDGGLLLGAARRGLGAGRPDRRGHARCTRAYLTATTMTFAGITACQIGTAFACAHDARLAALDRRLLEPPAAVGHRVRARRSPPSSSTSRRCRPSSAPPTLGVARAAAAARLPRHRVGVRRAAALVAPPAEHPGLNRARRLRYLPPTAALGELRMRSGRAVGEDRRADARYPSALSFHAHRRPGRGGSRFVAAVRSRTPLERSRAPRAEPARGCGGRGVRARACAPPRAR